MPTYHDGPCDGFIFDREPLAPKVERVVGLLDVTPEHVLTPRRRITVTAVYRWDEADRLDFDGLRADYQVVHL